MFPAMEGSRLSRRGAAAAGAVRRAHAPGRVLAALLLLLLVGPVLGSAPQTTTERLLEAKRRQESGQAPGTQGQAGAPRQPGTGQAGEEAAVVVKGEASYRQDDAARSRTRPSRPRSAPRWSR